MKYFTIFDQDCQFEKESLAHIYRHYPNLQRVNSISDIKEKGVLFRWGIQIKDKDKIELELGKPHTSTQIYAEGYLILLIPDTKPKLNPSSEETLGLTINSFIKQKNVLDHNETKQSIQQVANDWKGYRFGDCFVHPHWNDWNTGDQMKLNEYLYKNYPNSLISKYSVRNEFRSTQNSQLLKEIVQSNQIFEQDIPCVGIHLRCGDVLLQNTFQQKLRYIPPSEYNTIGQLLTQKGLKKVCLIFGLHYYYENVANLTLKYVQDVASVFIKYGIKVRYRMGTPDEDVMFMSNVKYFIPAKSHYSLVIAKELANGKVLQCFKSVLKYQHE